MDVSDTSQKTLEEEIADLDAPIDMTISAKDVLYNNMVFYNSRAMKLAAAVIRIIKLQDKSRADLLVQMSKEMTKYNELAIDCATRLAPYAHAKLQSVETKSTVEHRYVVRTPTPIKGSKEWLEQCGVLSYGQDQPQVSGPVIDIPATPVSTGELPARMRRGPSNLNTDIN